MKTSYVFLAMSLILIFGMVSKASQNLDREVNESSVPYELKLSPELKNSEQVIFSESETDSFIDESLDLEVWMSDLSKWK